MSCYENMSKGSNFPCFFEKLDILDMDWDLEAHVLGNNFGNQQQVTFLFMDHMLLLYPKVVTAGRFPKKKEVK